MGFDTARFVDEVDAELICSICHGVLEDPRQVYISEGIASLTQFIVHAFHVLQCSCVNLIVVRGQRCASGCVVECRICNWEVAGLNLGLGYFAPRSTQPSIPPV